MTNWKEHWKVVLYKYIYGTLIMLTYSLEVLKMVFMSCLIRIMLVLLIRENLIEDWYLPVVIVLSIRKLFCRIQ